MRYGKISRKTAIYRQRRIGGLKSQKCFLHPFYKEVSLLQRWSLPMSGKRCAEWQKKWWLRYLALRCRFSLNKAKKERKEKTLATSTWPIQAESRVAEAEPVAANAVAETDSRAGPPAVESVSKMSTWFAKAEGFLMIAFADVGEDVEITFELFFGTVWSGAILDLKRKWMSWMRLTVKISKFCKILVTCYNYQLRSD